ncbi:hypothetical protein GCM10008018_45420 [Paenibacillus marchantiophytorum]|uniref:Uncharacterized protein n=1 Tax=Paenibacillus marchantiophytorum TaxID=1619310 RepID=A0ABQ1EZ02_9BACL|nr:hypothetical protein [Paenibacillus marchantiophytorum]GFZ93884.1 hypothetical protein GCM10008018_45420 [Paenibacillus marchantiophytorum]
MLTVEQYIEQMKKKDKLNEFNFKNHAENMTTVIKYVMDYFNTYLDPESIDYEKMKIEQSVSKIEQEIGSIFPKSKDFIIDYYKRTKGRIDKIYRSWFKELKYVDLFNCQEDFKDAVDKFCESSKMRGTGIEQNKDRLIILTEEVREQEIEKPSIAGFKYLDHSLIAWVKEVYREYGVNLFQFAQSYIRPYYEEYVELIYNREREQFYYINRYNHRYNNNPFDIDEMYEENRHRPFINGRKGELEMLVMYVWIFEDVHDTEYWPEYVNLCVSTGRVSIVGPVNIMIPVKIKDMEYPNEILSSISFVETITGLIKEQPEGKYILRLHYEKDNDAFWKDTAKLNQIIINLCDTFAKYGEPLALELLPPLRAPEYNAEEFFTQYRLLEKSMKKYRDMKIVLVNGPHRHSSKPKYLMQTTEDIVRLRGIVKELKFKMKFAIDITKLMKNKNYLSQFEDDFNQLSEMRNAIVGIHLSKISTRSTFTNYLYKEDKVYLNKHDYPRTSDLMGCISALLNDNLSRYFIPDGMSSAHELEDLTDDLLRGGFTFSAQGS